MQLFDTHAHLQDAAFDDVDAVLARARDTGLVGITLCGYDAPSNEAALRMAAESPLLLPAVGFHPHEADAVSDAMLRDLEAQARLPEVVAIGEIGLDFFRDLSARDAQRRLIDAQLGIAARVAKPVCVHSRGAEDDAYTHLAEYSRACGWAPGAPPVGVMHCFGGMLEQAQRYVAIGFLISFACVVTYPRNDEARRMAAGLPLDAIVIETDSPYLPPQSLRGKRNEPANVAAAAQAIAEARGISVESVADASTRSAQRLFGVQIAAGVASW
jgi:TatD DNase family protein